MSAKDALAKATEKEPTEKEDLKAMALVAQRLVAEVEGKETEPFNIEDDEDFELAAEMLNHAKLKIKEIKARSETVTKPMYQALEAFRDIYRPTMRAYEQVEKLLKKKVEGYVLAKKQAEAKSMRLIAEASREGDFTKAMKVSGAMTSAPEKKGISVKIFWSFRVKKQLKVPRKFLSVDPDKVEAYIKEFKGKPEPVEGLEFFEATSSSVRAR